ncbi:MAG: 50S ribosomal protein L3 [Puniceicoccales bacterium]|jgi:large subunit ribosomal protein L3|nr:50S ribosomal protein L3 [Puniceicoccales bacterium]
MEKKKNTLLIGKKVGMTQIYSEASELVPVTIIQIEKSTVVRVKTIERDGYSAVQFGFGRKSAKHSTRSELGQDKLIAGSSPLKLQEMRVDSAEEYSLGDIDLLGEFAASDVVDVIGTTKGRGFAGVMKRHNFCGGPASHGSMFHRQGGSYGQRQWVGHVFKGRKMPGHFGCERRTIQNLPVVKVDYDKGLLIVRGSIPGAKNGFVLVRRAIKSL